MKSLYNVDCILFQFLIVPTQFIINIYIFLNCYDLYTNINKYIYILTIKC